MMDLMLDLLPLQPYTLSRRPAPEKDEYGITAPADHVPLAGYVYVDIQPIVNPAESLDENGLKVVERAIGYAATSDFLRGDRLLAADGTAVYEIDTVQDLYDYRRLILRKIA